MYDLSVSSFSRVANRPITVNPTRPDARIPAVKSPAANTKGNKMRQTCRDVVSTTTDRKVIRPTEIPIQEPRDPLTAAAPQSISRPTDPITRRLHLRSTSSTKRNGENVETNPP